MDRRKEKPNILFQDEFYYLIDHELSISESTTESYLSSVKLGNWNYLYKNHVLYEYLKREGKKENIFEHLIEILVSCLDKVSQQLTEREYDTKHLHIFKQYLRYIKTNPQLFIQELERQVR